MADAATQIPETPLFDRARSLKGYKLNKMAMDLGKPENREAFKADEDAYLARYGLTDEEKSAVKARDWHDTEQGEGEEFLFRATRIKTIWTPFGV